MIVFIISAVFGWAATIITRTCFEFTKKGFNKRLMRIEVICLCALSTVPIAGFFVGFFLIFACSTSEMKIIPNKFTNYWFK